jgi:hypothetical protein
MSEWRSRLTRLEARQRRQHPPGHAHFSAVVWVPNDVDRDDWGLWLSEQRCRCGLIGCAERTIHVLLPAKAADAEEWAARYGETL